MYQYNLKYGCIDTFFLYQSNLKYLIDINTTIAIGEAGGNRILIVDSRYQKYTRKCILALLKLHLKTEVVNFVLVSLFLILAAEYSNAPILKPKA